MVEEIYYKQINNGEKVEMSAEEVAQLKANRDAILKDQWKRDRIALYGSWNEQLDLMWHDIQSGNTGKLSSWYKHVEAVKKAVPKPEGA